MPPRTPPVLLGKTGVWKNLTPQRFGEISPAREYFSAADQAESRYPAGLRVQSVVPLPAFPLLNSKRSATSVLRADVEMNTMKAMVFKGKDHIAVEEVPRPRPKAGEAVLTEGRGADVTIEALGHQETFENALRATRPGGTLSSLGVYSGKLVAPCEAIYAGLADQKIVTTLCPGGEERMRRLMAMITTGRVDLKPLVAHTFTLDDIHEAFELFSHQRDGVLKVALYPDAKHADASHRAGVRGSKVLERTAS